MKTFERSLVKEMITQLGYCLIMSRYFCIGFIDFMLKRKSLLDYANLFSPNDYENNAKIIFKYFQ